MVLTRLIRNQIKKSISASASNYSFCSTLVREILALFDAMTYSL